VQDPVSEYRAVWLFAMFDLPVDDKEARRDYTQFRKALLKHGFSMLQYSVYARCFESEESSGAYRKHVQAAVPPGGQVRVMAVTDHQFGKMDVFMGRKRVEAEKPPKQLVLF
jgi:CRISPR-associated protein Cas2